MKILRLLLIAYFANFTLCAQTINEVESDPPKVTIEIVETSASQSNAAIKNGISYCDSLVLGLVEGLTEYLPVSSTGHLLLANAFLGLDADEPLSDAAGNPILNDDFEPPTLKSAADAYAIVIQLGAIAAVAFIYWEWLLKMFFGLLGRNPEGLRLLINIIAAFLPAAVIGFLLHDLIESWLFGTLPIIAALFFGGLLMFWVQKRYNSKHSYPSSAYLKMRDMRVKDALVIGFLQCIAMWPGTSRSMMTIIGGYAVGLKPADAARFSFLLGLATLSAASIFKMYTDGASILRAISAGPLLFGIIVAFVSAALTVKWLVGFLNRRGLAPFAYYRIILAAILSAFVYFNIL